MLSNQNKRVSSIAKKLTREMRRKKMRAYRISAWLMLLLFIFTYAVSTEYAMCGEVHWRSSHYFKLNGDVWDEYEAEVLKQSGFDVNDRGNGGMAKAVRGVIITGYAIKEWKLLDGLIVYRCTELQDTQLDDGTTGVQEVIIFERAILVELVCAFCIMLALIIFEQILCAITAITDRTRIKNMLKPITEMTIKADELTRMEFDDSKYQHLEQSIAALDPEGTLPVTTGDKELESLENAINNLLVRMRESNMQQARFVNDASHELRTPIAVIEGYANMLARWGREDEKVLDESITAIQHESAHMKYLIEQLLFLARGDSGRTVLKFEDVSLTDMMREIYEESLMIDENHVYRFNSSEENIALKCDPTLMKQAVRILVDNAAKYTKEKDEITLSVGRNEQGRPYLQVDDTGIGMAESDVAHMFERFYRSDEVRTYKGTGLGLSIAKWIVDKHEGHFEVVSREDIGTRIRIVL